MIQSTLVYVCIITVSKTLYNLYNFWSRIYWETSTKSSLNASHYCCFSSTCVFNHSVLFFENFKLKGSTSHDLQLKGIHDFILHYLVLFDGYVTLWLVVRLWQHCKGRDNTFKWYEMSLNNATPSLFLL